MKQHHQINHWTIKTHIDHSSCDMNVTRFIDQLIIELKKLRKHPIKFNNHTKTHKKKWDRFMRFQLKDEKGKRKRDRDLKIVSFPNIVIRNKWTNTKNIIILGFFHHYTKSITFKLSDHLKNRSLNSRIQRIECVKS